MWRLRRKYEARGTQSPVFEFESFEALVPQMLEEVNGSKKVAMRALCGVPREDADDQRES